ncbi:hypothetical protein JHD50_09330 [Sulfurimonas sp. MAG313]|nr:hypothetical protein [Sulfurimonas sp. MAG313]MDF1881499.1 hypothetical protein [Sulfurimonas sp. MAG313]
MLDLSDKTKTQYEYKRDRDRDVNEMRRVVSTWNKDKLQSYVYNHNKKYPCSDAGMAAILHRFISSSEFQIGTMSEDLKMGFDIVLAISRNKKIYFQTTDLILTFVKEYKDVIQNYDRQSAQTYKHKLMVGYEQSVSMVNTKVSIEQEMRLKY